MTIEARIRKLEEKFSTHDQHNWLFTTIVGDGEEVIGSIQDINPKYDLSIQNIDRLPTVEFLALATETFGIDMAAVYYDAANEVIEMI